MLGEVVGLKESLLSGQDEQERRHSGEVVKTKNKAPIESEEIIVMACRGSFLSGPATGFTAVFTDGNLLYWALVSGGVQLVHPLLERAIFHPLNEYIEHKEDCVSMFLKKFEGFPHKVGCVGTGYFPTMGLIEDWIHFSKRVNDITAYAGIPLVFVVAYLLPKSTEPALVRFALITNIGDVVKYLIYDSPYVDLVYLSTGVLYGLYTYFNGQNPDHAAVLVRSPELRNHVIAHHESEKNFELAAAGLNNIARIIQIFKTTIAIAMPFAWIIKGVGYGGNFVLIGLLIYKIIAALCSCCADETKPENVTESRFGSNQAFPKKIAATLGASMVKAINPDIQQDHRIKVTRAANDSLVQVKAQKSLSL